MAMGETLRLGRNEILSSGAMRVVRDDRIVIRVTPGEGAAGGDIDLLVGGEERLTCSQSQG